MNVRVLMCVLLVAVVSIAQSRDVRIALRQTARPLLEQKRYEEAVKLYTDAAAKQTDDALQAHCLVEASRIVQDQLQDTDRALQLAGQIRDPQRAAGRELVVLVRGKQYARAVERFGQTDMTAWPADLKMDCFAARGEALLEQKQSELAMADLDVASQSVGDPGRRVWACYQLGQLREKAGDMPGAVAAYQRGMDVTTATYAWRNRCFLRFQELRLERGEVDPALADLAAVDVAKLPGDYWRGEFLLLHARAHTLKNQNGQAVQLYSAVLRLPEAIKAHKTAAEARIAELTGAMAQP
jgi:tetratricopeptide (TPR) repeat protein